MRRGRGAAQAGSPPENFAEPARDVRRAQPRATSATLTEGDLASYYKDAPLTLSDADAVRATETPKAGVTIRWDAFGVPYIEGDTREDAAFGSGYAGTEDRMFLMDLLRHVGAARAAEFLGPTEANAAMDQEQLRARLLHPRGGRGADRAGGRALRRGGQAPASPRSTPSSTGINAAQQEMCPARASPGAGLPGRVRRAAEAARSRGTRADVVYVASLVGGIFGKGGGARVRERPLAAAARGDSSATTRRAGSSTTSRSPNDPQAPTTASDPAPYGSGPVDPALPGVALPDLDGPTAPGTGADAGSGAVPVPGPAALQGQLGERPMSSTGRSARSTSAGCPTA